MTEEERCALEKSAPTTLSQPRAKDLSWDEELLLAAEEGDIPRMAHALKQGARPNAVNEHCANAAHRYAYGISRHWEKGLRVHFASTSLHPNQVWAWFKARGIALNLRAHVPPQESPWSALSTNYASLAHPIEANCVEVNLWALWGNVSHQARTEALSYIDTHLSKKEGASCANPTPLQSLKELLSKNPTPPLQSLKGLPCFTSKVMQEVVAFEGIDHAACGTLLSASVLQDRVLALSSLLESKMGFSVETYNNRSDGYKKDGMLLGLWAYAPPSVLCDLASLPSYRTTLTRCLRHSISEFHAIEVPPSLDPLITPPPTHLVARRLARGTRTLLQTGFEFSKEVLEALLTLEETRPLLEQHLLKKTLDASHTETELHVALRPRPRF